MLRRCTQDLRRPFEQRLAEAVPAGEIDFESVVRDSAAAGDDVVDHLIRRGVLSEHLLATLYSEHYLLPLFEPVDQSGWDALDPAAAAHLDADFCRRHRVLPIVIDGQWLQVAIDRPDSLTRSDDIRTRTGLAMRAMFATSATIDEGLAQLFPGSGTSPTVGNAAAPLPPIPFEEITSDRTTDPKPAARTSNASAATDDDRHADDLIRRLLSTGADDIHLSARGDDFRVQVRLGGRLSDVADTTGGARRLARSVRRRCAFPKALPVGGRRGELSIDDTLTIAVHGCPIDGGERMRLRRTSAQVVAPELSSLDMPETVGPAWRRLAARSHGLMIATGPCGSGKAATLYATAATMTNRHRVVVDDQARWDLPGATRLRIDRPEETADGITAAMDQGGDVILIGRLCDPRSMDLAVRAAAGGALVLAGMTARSGSAVLNQMHSWGVSPHRIAESLWAVMTQRTVRTLCHCRTEQTVSPESRRRLGISSDVPLYRAIGCGGCRRTGFRGTRTLYDLTRVDPNATSVDSLTTDREDGIRRVAMDAAASGRTCLDEIRRVL